MFKPQLNIKINDTLGFINKNTGFELRGKVRGIFNTSKRYSIGVSLEGDRSTEVSWFLLDDIDVLEIDKFEKN